MESKRFRIEIQPDSELIGAVRKGQRIATLLDDIPLSEAESIVRYVGVSIPKKSKHRDKAIRAGIPKVKSSLSRDNVVVRILKKWFDHRCDERGFPPLELDLKSWEDVLVLRLLSTATDKPWPRLC